MEMIKLKLIKNVIHLLEAVCVNFALNLTYYLMFMITLTPLILTMFWHKFSIKIQ